MHKGFTKTTLGLLAAALLSSSAFAVGPTIEELPNVFITDKTKAPSPVPDDGDGSTVATNVYRFTDAFVLSDYVEFDPDSNNTTNDLVNVSWLFQEYAWNNTAAGNARTGSARTIKIGESVATGQLAHNSATVATYSDVIASTLPNVGSLADGLDFVNNELSPDVNDFGADPNGNFAPGTDAAVIELFVAAASVNNQVDSTAFTVYTTNDDSFQDGDLVTFSSNIWNPELCLDSFGGWEVEELSPAATDGTARFSPTPTVTGTSVAGLGTNLLTAPATAGLNGETDGTPAGNTGPSQLQYVSWKSMRRDVPGMVTVPVAADDTLFMIRWQVSADAATVAAASTNRRGTSVQVPMVRLRSGEVALGGNGQAREHFGPVGLNNLVEANQEARTFFYAKEGGNYDTGEGFVDSTLPPAWGSDDDPPVVFGLFFDVLDQVTSTDTFAATVGGQRLYGLTLNQVQIYSATRGDLGTGTVVFNQGVDTFTLAAGEPAPPSGQAQYNLQWWDSRDEGAGSRATFAPEEDNIIGTTNSPLSIILSDNGTNAVAVATWDTRDYASSAFLAPPDGIGTGSEVVTVDNDVLVAVDVWMSSPQGATVNNLLPGVVDTTTGGVSATRFGFQTDIWGGTGSGESGPDDPDMPGTVNFWRQGRTGLFEFNSGNREQYDTAYLIPATYALQTGARRLTFFFEPQAIDDADGINALSFRPIIQSYTAPATASDLAADVNGTINIQRVVITTYDRPALPNDICN